MSGPKVVRIVTREERIATCEAVLARLEAALQDWERAARRTGARNAQVQAMRSRHAELEAALAADRFDEVQRQASKETEFVQREHERLQAEVVAREALARRIKKRSREIRPEMRAALKRLRTATLPGVSDAQRALADRLKEGDEGRSFKDWLAEHPSQADAETVHIETQLAELSVLFDAGAIEAFETKLAQAQREALPERRALLLDSLTIDLAKAVKSARNLEALRRRLHALAFEFRHLNSEGAKRRAESILATLSEGKEETLTATERDASRALTAEREAVAARARREAVMKGLAALGYQVHDGLETAWAKDGRVVLKRPAQPGYGVEFSGKAEDGRLQARVVALRSAGDLPNKARDTDAERMWCADFSALKQKIAGAGGAVTIERALGVGEVPLKVVEDATTTAASADLAVPSRERSLPRP